MVAEAKTLADVAKLAGDKVAVLYFWASWCEPCKVMDTVFATLAAEYPSAAFLKVEAEEADDVTEHFGVTTVPYFVVAKSGKAVDRVEGADAPGLTAKVAQHAAAPAAAAAASATAAAPAPAAAAAAGGAAEPKEKTLERIKRLLSSHEVVLFMKGTADEPRCGFSRRTADAVYATGVPFTSCDILRDEPLRQVLKEYSNWPTYPQLYVKGELLGGCDIVTEMAESGTLKDEILAKLGPDSQAAVEAGGGDPLQARLKQLVSSKPVMLFMKGTADAPRCGFSGRVVEALRQAGVSNFGTFDILSDEQVRQGLKDYSNWPTYPQLYVNGELLGGCDIVTEMAESGELKTAIDEMIYRT